MSSDLSRKLDKISRLVGSKVGAAAIHVLVQNPTLTPEACIKQARAATRKKQGKRQAKKLRKALRKVVR